MAEIQNTNRQTHKRRGNKKLSTRVDLTPMVDLGFLLITFFIFTTSLSQPAAMNLAMPKDTNLDYMPTAESGAITLLLAKNNLIYYYFGKNIKDLKSSGYNGLRNIIIDKKRITKADDLFVIIKPGKEARYENAVNVLNEMSINDVKRYAMVDPSGEEYQMMGRK